MPEPPTDWLSVATANCRQAYLRSALTHERAAQHHERLLNSNHGDPHEHQDKAAWHCAAARQDRITAWELGTRWGVIEAEPGKVP